MDKNILKELKEIKGITDDDIKAALEGNRYYDYSMGFDIACVLHGQEVCDTGTDYESVREDGSLLLFMDNSGYVCDIPCYPPSGRSYWFVAQKNYFIEEDEF